MWGCCRSSRQALSPPYQLPQVRRSLGHASVSVDVSLSATVTSPALLFVSMIRWAKHIFIYNPCMKRIVLVVVVAAVLAVSACGGDTEPQPPAVPTSQPEVIDTSDRPRLCRVPPTRTTGEYHRCGWSGVEYHHSTTGEYHRCGWLCRAPQQHRRRVPPPLPGSCRRCNAEAGLDGRGPFGGGRPWKCHRRTGRVCGRRDSRRSRRGASGTARLLPPLPGRPPEQGPVFVTHR